MDCSMPGFPAAAAAKLLQSCLTLCNPIDGSPSGSLVPGIFQARTLEWVAISFSTSLPCLSPTPGAYSNSCPLSRWCHPTISSCVVPFSSCLQSFPASGSLQMSPLFTSDGQSIGVSALASVLPVNIQDWFPVGWTGWSPCSPRDPKESSTTSQFESINFSSILLYVPTLTLVHDY